MSPRLRVYAVVATCAAAAAGLTVVVTLATRTTPQKPPQGRAGSPPLVLELSIRTDPEAVALRRAADLYNREQPRRAEAIFGRYRSLEAEVGSSLAAWPERFNELRTLAKDHPRSSVVQLNYGLALLWRGDSTGATAAWRAARRAQPDTPYAVRAGDLLHPNFPRGLPTFVPSFRAPPGLGNLPPPKQLSVLKGRARADGVRNKLLYGVALQRLGRQISALREFKAAARVAPADPEPQVAVAVARFDKAEPSRTFSRLGPLARRYPTSQSVRFHLGLCLLWLGSVDEARRQLRLARAAGPQTPLGVESARFLDELAGARTK